MELTDAQESVLSFLVSFSDECQCPPTRAEIANNFGWSSPNAAQEHLEALQRKGYIRLTPNKSRGIFVIRRHEAA